MYKLHQTGRARCTLYTSCTTPRPLTDVHQAMANNLQQKASSYTSCMDLYGFRSRTQTAHLGYVYTTCTKLGGNAGPCMRGVQLPNHSRMFTRQWRTMCSERHFRTLPVRICTAPRNQTRTAHLDYVYTTCTKLGGPVGPCTPGV